MDISFDVSGVTGRDWEFPQQRCPILIRPSLTVRVTARPTVVGRLYSLLERPGVSPELFPLRQEGSLELQLHTPFFGNSYYEVYHWLHRNLHTRPEVLKYEVVELSITWEHVNQA